MISLGIESTAHTLGVGIVNEKEVLANESSVYSGKGIHPRKAADHHADVLKNVLDSALKKSNVSLEDLDMISFSQGPGIGPCLRIGATAARTLSLRLKIPIIGVNHCVSHIEIGKFATEAKDPVTRLWRKHPDNSIRCQKIQNFWRNAGYRYREYAGYLWKDIGVKIPVRKRDRYSSCARKEISTPSLYNKGDGFFFYWCIDRGIEIYRKREKGRYCVFAYGNCLFYGSGGFRKSFSPYRKKRVAFNRRYSCFTKTQRNV
jgi:hypothetical protein